MQVNGTNRAALAQIVFCRGCCCGREDRGFPAVPVERLKAVWKAERLNSTVQLTISGCLGPCDRANVALILTPSGLEWYGDLSEPADFDAAIEWVRECRAANQLLPRPATWESRRFVRFPDESNGSACAVRLDEDWFPEPITAVTS